MDRFDAVEAELRAHQTERARLGRKVFALAREVFSSEEAATGSC